MAATVHGGAGEPGVPDAARGGKPRTTKPRQIGQATVVPRRVTNRWSRPGAGAPALANRRGALIRPPYDSHLPDLGERMEQAQGSKAALEQSALLSDLPRDGARGRRGRCDTRHAT